MIKLITIGNMLRTLVRNPIRKRPGGVPRLRRGVKVRQTEKLIWSLGERAPPHQEKVKLQREMRTFAERVQNNANSIMKARRSTNPW